MNKELVDEGTQLYAMKMMSKKRLFQLRSSHSVVEEMRILSQVFHTTIMNLKYAFQDNENVYMVSEHLKGGDLEYHLYKR